MYAKAIAQICRVLHAKNYCFPTLKKQNSISFRANVIFFLSFFLFLLLFSFSFPILSPFFHYFSVSNTFRNSFHTCHSFSLDGIILYLRPFIIFRRFDCTPTPLPRKTVHPEPSQSPQYIIYHVPCDVMPRAVCRSTICALCTSRIKRLSIVNLVKSGSLYNEGMRPLMYSEIDAKESKIGWRRCGDNIAYFKNEDSSYVINFNIHT